jgi:hypothetical protein
LILGRNFVDKNRNSVSWVPDANFYLAVHNQGFSGKHEHAYDHRDFSNILCAASLETEPNFLGAAAERDDNNGALHSDRLLGIISAIAS